MIILSALVGLLFYRVLYIAGLATFTVLPDEYDSMFCSDLTAFLDLSPR